MLYMYKMDKVTRIVLSADFGKYLDALKPFLAAALRNTEDYQSCTAAIGVVGDLTRAVPVPLTQQLDEIMVIFLEHLRVCLHLLTS